MADDKLHKEHRKRLRQRFSETGFTGFQPHEIMELLLFYSIPRVNTNETAHRLLEHFGSIYDVMEADKEELLKINGIGEKSAIFIKICRDICRYYLMNEVSAEKSEPPKEFVRKYFSSSLSEIFLILNVDSYMNIKNISTFPSDAFSSGKITARELAETVLRSKTCSIIAAHCHKNRLPVPDSEDYYAAKVICESLSPLNVKIADYIISDGNTVFSMREKGAFSFE